MRVFLSWSGKTSHEVAAAFHDWLPNVFQAVDAFLSSGDIEAGERWNSRIATSLKEINFGIIFLTRANIEAPWVMFEAGAMAKGLDEARVIPVLCGIKEIEAQNNPLLQFQYIHLDREGVRRLCKTLYLNLHEAKPVSLDVVFEVWWPQLEQRLSAIDLSDTVKVKKQADPGERMDRLEMAVSEMSFMVRRLLSDTEDRHLRAKRHPMVQVETAQDRDRARASREHAEQVANRAMVEAARARRAAARVEMELEEAAREGDEKAGE